MARSERSVTVFEDSPGSWNQVLILANAMLRGTSIEGRVAAASAAGYSGIGLSIAAYRRLIAQGWSPRRLRALLEEHGLRLTELEAGAGFAADGPAPKLDALPGLTYMDAAVEAEIYSIADFFGSRHMQVVGAFAGPLEPNVVERFAGLCDRAGEHGLLVALEFVPTTTIPDARLAGEIVTQAGRVNGGLCVDSWHCYRGTTTAADLRNLDPTKVFMIQLDDGPVVPESPSFIADTITNRVCPGEGEFDLVGFLQALWDQGVNAPISVEVLSAALDRMPASEAAARSAEATRRVLALAGKAD